MKFLERFRPQSLTPEALEVEFSGIDPIIAVEYDPQKPAAETTYEICEHNIKLTSSAFPQVQKGELKAWLILKPKYMKAKEVIPLKLCQTEVQLRKSLTFSLPFLKEGNAKAYLKYSDKKLVLTGIEFSSMIERAAKLST